MGEIFNPNDVFNICSQISFLDKSIFVLFVLLR